MMGFDVPSAHDASSSQAHQTNYVSRAIFSLMTLSQHGPARGSLSPRLQRKLGQLEAQLAGWRGGVHGLLVEIKTYVGSATVRMHARTSDLNEPIMPVWPLRGAVASLSSRPLDRPADAGFGKALAMHGLPLRILRAARAARSPSFSHRFSAQNFKAGGVGGHDGCERHFLGKPKINFGLVKCSAGSITSWDGFDADVQKIIRDWCLDRFARDGSASGIYRSRVRRRRYIDS
jgi:hypothetical protein